MKQSVASPPSPRQRQMARAVTTLGAALTLSVAMSCSKAAEEPEAMTQSALPTASSSGSAVNPPPPPPSTNNTASTSASSAIAPATTTAAAPPPPPPATSNGTPQV